MKPALPPDNSLAAENSPAAESSTPLGRYEQKIARSELSPDAGQKEVITHLQVLYDLLAVHHEQESGLLSRLFSSTAPAPAGLYLWGDVGRGKTMLMDMFYDTINREDKIRQHFHAFMRDLHGRLHSWRQLKPKDDLLKRVVSEITQRYRIICLDELQIHDVADATIIARLFSLLLADGCTIVCTSNRPPKDLYQGGIQRDQFLPFIDLIERKLEVIKLKSDTDYRLEKLQSLQQSYLTPLNAETDEQLYDIYGKLTHHHESQPETICVDGRRLEIGRTACGVAWLTFTELCERPLGARDYLELAAMFHTLILQNIPQMNPAKRNEAKRFVTLIDILYEHNVKLICSADAPPDALYQAGDGSFEFERTISRLHEMQSAGYMGAEHISE